MTYTKQEVLGLHLLSEKEQIQWLFKMRIIKNRQTDGIMPVLESLADCAFRLRDETVERCGIWTWKEYIADLLHAGVYQRNTWTGKATPTNWIQAALLARIEKENEK